MLETFGVWFLANRSRKIRRSLELTRNDVTESVLVEENGIAVSYEPNSIFKKKKTEILFQNALSYVRSH